ncbi:MAG TPA: hypothetical protein ENK02_07730 [Planctomycetes bacterium]|nr:hypothetical protein [Planctomycetota bacterium]
MKARPHSPKEQLGALGGSLLTFFVSFALFALLRQGRPYGDGITILCYLRDRNFLAHHLLFLPDLALFADLAGNLGIPERTAAFLFSAFCAAAGLAFLHLVFRRHRSRGEAWLLTLAMGTAPVLLFFGTQVENHAHHFFWLSFFLFALDNALTKRDAEGPSLLRFALSGLLLVGVYASHSSSLLLFPALALLVHRVLAGPRLLPTRGEWLPLLLLFVPPLLAKLLDPWFKAQVLGGGDAYLHDTSLQFALSLMSSKSPGEWLQYLLDEVLLAGPAVLTATLALLWKRWTTLGLALLALLPYILFFGHWPVYEFGAYYLAPFAFLLFLAGRSTLPLRPPLAILLLGIIASQSVYGLKRVLTWERDHSAAPWRFADDAARAAGKGGFIVVETGTKGLFLDYDHPEVGYSPVENYEIVIEQQLRANPQGRELLAKEVAERFLAFARRGPLLVEDKAWERIAAQYPRVIQALEKHFDKNPVHEGRFRGFRLLPK